MSNSFGSIGLLQGNPVGMSGVDLIGRSGSSGKQLPPYNLVTGSSFPIGAKTALPLFSANSIPLIPSQVRPDSTAIPRIATQLSPGRSKDSFSSFSGELNVKPILTSPRTGYRVKSGSSGSSGSEGEPILPESVDTKIGQNDSSDLGGSDHNIVNIMTATKDSHNSDMDGYSEGMPGVRNIPTSPNGSDKNAPIKPDEILPNKSRMSDTNPPVFVMPTLPARESVEITGKNPSEAKPVSPQGKNTSKSSSKSPQVLSSEKSTGNDLQTAESADLPSRQGKGNQSSSQDRGSIPHSSPQSPSPSSPHPSPDSSPQSLSSSSSPFSNRSTNQPKDANWGQNSSGTQNQTPSSRNFEPNLRNLTSPGKRPQIKPDQSIAPETPISPRQTADFGSASQNKGVFEESTQTAPSQSDNTNPLKSPRHTNLSTIAGKRIIPIKNKEPENSSNRPETVREVNPYIEPKPEDLLRDVEKSLTSLEGKMYPDGMRPNDQEILAKIGATQVNSSYREVNNLDSNKAIEPPTSPKIKVRSTPPSQTHSSHSSQTHLSHSSQTSSDSNGRNQIPYQIEQPIRSQNVKEISGHPLTNPPELALHHENSQGRSTHGYFGYDSQPIQQINPNNFATYQGGMVSPISPISSLSSFSFAPSPQISSSSFSSQSLSHSTQISSLSPSSLSPPNFDSLKLNSSIMPSPSYSGRSPNLVSPLSPEHNSLASRPTPVSGMNPYSLHMDQPNRRVPSVYDLMNTSSPKEKYFPDQFSPGKISPVDQSGFNGKSMMNLPILEITPNPTYESKVGQTSPIGSQTRRVRRFIRVIKDETKEGSNITKVPPTEESFRDNSMTNSSNGINPEESPNSISSTVPTPPSNPSNPSNPSSPISPTEQVNNQPNRREVMQLPRIIGAIPRPDYDSMPPNRIAIYVADFHVKFRILRQSFPELNIPNFDNINDVNQLHSYYERYLHLINSESNTDSYRNWLVLFWGMIEFAGWKFNLPVSGYTVNQIARSNKYNRLMIQLGEKNYLNFGQGWPIEAQILLMMGKQLVFFMGLKLIMNFMDAGAANNVMNAVEQYIDGRPAPGATAQPADPNAPVPPPPSSSAGGLGGIISGIMGGGNGLNGGGLTSLFSAFGNIFNGGSSNASAASSTNATASTSTDSSAAASSSANIPSNNGTNKTNARRRFRPQVDPT